MEKKLKMLPVAALVVGLILSVIMVFTVALPVVTQTNGRITATDDYSNYTLTGVIPSLGNWTATPYSANHRHCDSYTWSGVNNNANTTYTQNVDFTIYSNGSILWGAIDPSQLNTTKAVLLTGSCQPLDYISGGSTNPGAASTIVRLIPLGLGLLTVVTVMGLAMAG